MSISPDAAAVAAAKLVQAAAVLRAQRDTALGEHEPDPEAAVFAMYRNAVQFVKETSGP